MNQEDMGVEPSTCERELLLRREFDSETRHGLEKSIDIINNKTDCIFKELQKIREVLSTHNAAIESFLTIRKRAGNVFEKVFSALVLGFIAWLMYIFASHKR